MKKTLLLLAVALYMPSAFSAEESLPKKIGDSVKQGGDAAGRGIEKGGEAVGRGLKKGAEATVEGVKKAEVWVGKKLQKGGETLEKAGE